MTVLAQPSRLTAEEYGELVQRARELVAELIPADAVVAVVSRGDSDLLDLGGPEGWHFPQNERGVYAGHHPADSTAAISQLEALRGKGAGFLLVPATAFWWFDHYRDFKRHLDRQYWLLAHDESCALYSLSDRPDEEADAADMGPRRRQELTRQIQEVLAATLPDDASLVVWAHAQPKLLELEGRDVHRFPGDGASDDQLIGRIDELRAAGADFLLVSATALPWLDERAGFRRHLERQHRLAVEQRHLCRIYELTSGPTAAPPARRRRGSLLRRRLRRA